MRALVAGLWAPASGVDRLGGATWYASACRQSAARDRSIGVVPQRMRCFRT
jgi:ABC-type sulfate/molybdate transport systems ATPase subunit